MPNIAFVEDGIVMIQRLPQWFYETYPGVFNIYHYPNCEALLTAMDDGARFDGYIMDYDLHATGGVMNGTDGTAQILARHPGAIVIGYTNTPGEYIRDLFKYYGAKEMVLKEELHQLAQLLIQNLNL